jgi:hypothetical protein
MGMYQFINSNLPAGGVVPRIPVNVSFASGNFYLCFCCELHINDAFLQKGKVCYTRVSLLRYWSCQLRLIKTTCFYVVHHICVYVSPRERCIYAVIYIYIYIYAFTFYLCNVVIHSVTCSCCVFVYTKIRTTIWKGVDT